jgi:hypothetical protein
MVNPKLVYSSCHYPEGSGRVYGGSRKNKRLDKKIKQLQRLVRVYYRYTGTLLLLSTFDGKDGFITPLGKNMLGHHNVLFIDNRSNSLFSVGENDLESGEHVQLNGYALLHNMVKVYQRLTSELMDVVRTG